jgi:hypothetical protein
MDVSSKASNYNGPYKIKYPSQGKTYVNHYNLTFPC